MSRSRNSHASSAPDPAPPEEDLYAVLEIPRSASRDEIRRAYKKLALKSHPDKNPDNRAQAEAMFKRVSEAYEVLGDENTRRTYDTYGMAGIRQEAQGGGGGAPPDMSEFFGGFAGGAGGGGRSGGFGQDPFFSGGFGGFGGAGGGGGHARRGGAGFMFHDPFDVFRDFFGGDDPFAAFFDSARTGARSQRQQGAAQRQQDPFGGMGGFGGFGGMMDFGGMMGGGGGGGGGFSSTTFSSSSSFGGGRHGGGATSRSVQQFTEIRNGQKVTRTVTRVQNPDGTVTEDVDEKVEDMGGGQIEDRHRGSRHGGGHHNRRDDDFGGHLRF